MRLLGIDYGLARIGLAVCDPLGIATRPIGFVPRTDDAQAARIIAGVARQEQAEAIVLGLPLNADGSSGEAVGWVRGFAAVLARACSLPIHEQDERYSSGEAEELLKQEGRWPAKPGEVDAKVAAILLRRYLDGRG
jgi:putative Holliday junction resolvase